MATEYLKLEGKPTPEEEKLFWRKVHQNGPFKCWWWLASDGGNGYGKHRWRGKLYQAHRIAYYFVTGKDPGQNVLDQLCNDTYCCNPIHMIETTTAANTQRAAMEQGFFGSQTECTQGHKLIETNIYRASNRKKMCLTCKVERDKYSYDYRKDNILKEVPGIKARKISFEIATTIRSLSKDEGLSQRKLADKYGISQPNVGNILHNKIFYDSRGEWWK